MKRKQHRLDTQSQIAQDLRRVIGRQRLGKTPSERLPVRALCDREVWYPAEQVAYLRSGGTAWKHERGTFGHGFTSRYVGVEG